MENSFFNFGTSIRGKSLHPAAQNLLTFTHIKKLETLWYFIVKK